MKKKFLSFLMVICLVLGMLPTSALAAGNAMDFDLELRGKTQGLKANDEVSNSSLYYISKMGVESTTAGLGAMVSYLAIYMGVIFLITSAAVLALQQLCESADNVYRYELLKKVGVDEKVINKSLFTQIGIYFMIPLALAIIHSIVGLKFSQGVVSIVGNGSMMKYILITLLILIVVYGGYFIATYNNAKKMIK